GLYAVLVYAVGQRIAEFGVRMALGARASTIVRQVLGQGLFLVGLGVTLGLPLAWLFAHSFSERLFQVGTFDLPTLAAVTLVLGVIALLACLSPARRAAATDPVLALRNE
ncbi:MAG: FtsX-like permease family protein, partial [Dokdonella sp.]|nr:FtsX-like permease family protein [Dokdonella sp.]